MIESFVDLTYRGLSLGRHIKLSAVRPHSGYLEFAAPMPVGTTIGIAIDGGATLSVVVSEVREQIAGIEEPAGMTIVPALADATAASWWKERVALADEPAVSRVRTRPRSVSLAPASDSGGVVAAPTAGSTTKTSTVPPPTMGVASPAPVVAASAAPAPIISVPTAPMPTTVAAPIIAAAMHAPVAPAAPIVPAAPVVPTAAQAKTVSAFAEAAAAVMPPILPGQSGQMRNTGEMRAAQPNVEDGKKTVVMDAVDAVLLEQLTRNDSPIVDDGKRTQVMAAIDPSAFEDAGSSGSMPAAGDDGKVGPRGKRKKKGR
jgi:hypothetical protein